MGNFLRQILALFGAFLGICEHIKLFLYSKNAIKKQEKVLLKLMKDNKITEYGKKNNFTGVKSISDYQKLVPFSD